MKVNFISQKGEKTTKEVGWSTVEANPKVLAQSIRVYLGNQRKSQAKSKTRGQVCGSTRKIWRQKGTGNARHGSRKAPIFVGGGKAHGPNGSQNYSVRLNKKVAKVAWVTALVNQNKAGNLYIIADLEFEKTKNAADFWQKVLSQEKVKSALVIVEDNENQTLKKTSRNLSFIKLLNVDNINAYELVRAKGVFVTESAWKNLKTEK